MNYLGGLGIAHPRMKMTKTPVVKNLGSWSLRPFKTLILLAAFS